jgi:hypothetical protein
MTKRVTSGPPLDHVAQRHEGARALGHLEGLAAVLEQLHQLGQLDVERHAPADSAATAAFIRLT